MSSTKYKIIVEQHEDGFVAYPLGFAGCVVGQGDTADEALADVQSAIRFHIETFGKDAFAEDSPLLHAYMTETELATQTDGQVPQRRLEGARGGGARSSRLPDRA